MLTRATLAVVALSMALAAPVRAGEEPARAEQTAVILFAAKGVDPAQGARLGDVLRRTMRLAKKAGLPIPDVADLDAKNDGMLMVEGQQHLVQAVKYFTRGMNLLKQGRDPEAFEEFERSLHFYRNAYPYAQDDRLYTNIAFYAAQTVQKTKGWSKRAKTQKRCDAMGLAVELTGAREYLDDVNGIFRECDWEIEDPENREMKVDTVPKGARVYVDGQYRGVTPTVLTNLRRGEHVFTFVREGYRRVSRILKVGEKFSEARELEMGLHLKPGVYIGVYKDLIPVVRGTAKDEQGICRKVADTLEVDGLTMVLTVPSKKHGVRVFVIDWMNGRDRLIRKEFDVDLGTEDLIEKAVIEILAGVYGVDEAHLPSLAERPPIYFKLDVPPFVPEEDY